MVFITPFGSSDQDGPTPASGAGTDDYGQGDEAWRSKREGMDHAQEKTSPIGDFY